MKKLLVLSHCILNHASKVEMDENELQEEYACRDTLLQRIIAKQIQIIQLPCPEFILYGSQRWGHVKDQFMHPFYREACKKMLNPLILQLGEYTAHPESFQIMGIVSVEGSPSCGYHSTCRGDWKGEIGIDPAHIAALQGALFMEDQPGVFMEILEQELHNSNLSIPILTMEEANELLL